MRPRHLPRLHGLRAGRNPVPRPRRRAQGTAKVTKSVRRAAFEGTGALVTKAMIAVNVFVFLVCLAQGSSLNQVSRLALRSGSPLHPGRARPGRVVPADHRSVPPREPAPPRDEHARALDRRRSGRAGDRPGALPGALHRLGARGLGRGAAPQPGRDHRRRLRRDLRNPRRRPRARVTAKLRPRRTGLRADRVQPRSSRSRSRATSRSAATWAALPAARSACSRSRGSAGRTRSTAARD